MAAAMVLARKCAAAFTIPGSHAGRGLWHAPAPTRYRFSIQGADSKVPLPPPIPTGVNDARRGGEKWAAWAWAWAGAAFSSLPGGGGGGGDDDWKRRMWRALQDIKSFSQSQEVVSKFLLARVRLIAYDQIKLHELVLQSQASSIKGRSYNILYFSLFVGLLGWSYTRGAEKGKSSLDEFVSVHLSNIVTDPKVQESIRISASSFSRSFFREINPYYLIKDWMMGEAEVAVTSRSDLASRATCMAILIFALLPEGNSTGVTEGSLVSELNRLGMTEDSLIKKTVDLLVESRYLKKATINGPEGEKMTTFAPMVDQTTWYKDFSSGVLQTKIKKALGWRCWNSYTGF